MEELERQRQFFESLLEISPVAIITTELDATVTSWNPQAERVFGYTRDEAVGRNLDGLIAGPENLRADAERIQVEAATAGRFQGIVRRQRKDGTLVDVEVLAVPIAVDGEQVGYYAIYHDVSELQRQKRYYQSLVENSPSAIVTVDRDAIVTSWNPAAERCSATPRRRRLGATSTSSSPGTSGSARKRSMSARAARPGRGRSA